MYSSINYHITNWTPTYSPLRSRNILLPATILMDIYLAVDCWFTQYAPLNSFPGRLCQFILPTAEYESYHCLTPSPMLAIVNLFKCICSGGCVVVSYCDFNCMFIITNKVNTFTCLLAILFCEVSVQDTYSFFQRVISLFLIDL